MGSPADGMWVSVGLGQVPLGRSRDTWQEHLGSPYELWSKLLARVLCRGYIYIHTYIYIYRVLIQRRFGFIEGVLTMPHMRPLPQSPQHPSTPPEIRGLSNDWYHGPIFLVCLCYQIPLPCMAVL